MKFWALASPPCGGARVLSCFALLLFCSLWLCSHLGLSPHKARSSKGTTMCFTLCQGLQLKCVCNVGHHFLALLSFAPFWDICIHHLVKLGGMWWLHLYLMATIKIVVCHVDGGEISWKLGFSLWCMLQIEWASI